DAPIPRVLERMGCLQAQYAPSMYVGLWSRIASFERDALTRALVRRSVVQATLMRVTIHLVSRRDYWPLALATLEARRASWLRPKTREVGAAAMEQAAAIVRERLAAGPLHRKEVEQLVGKERAQGLQQWIDIVRVPPSGTWERRRADLYGLADDWVGAPEEGDGLELLVRRRLGGYGPATRNEIADWAGLKVGDLATVLERMKLRRFRAPDGAELLDLPRAPLPDPDTPAPVRFLPTWDAALLAHARRSGVLPEEHRPKLFHVRNPRSESPFLVDGAVAGVWRVEGGRVKLHPFEKLDAAAKRELRDEAERLAEFHA
ncbi:MAG: hypothetical protein QOG63_2128, partial [Thermoleophilaceae bacterium]|nr:hypothetical protein [Thermoleophilaceae bacterium]